LLRTHIQGRKKKLKFSDRWSGPFSKALLVHWTCGGPYKEEEEGRVTGGA
jgi:hypothetical protein